MSSYKINEWVKKSKQQGLTDVQIRSQLREAGWNENQINEKLPKPKLQTEYSLSGPSKNVSNKTTMLVFAIVLMIIVGAAAYYLGDSYGLPWGDNNNTNSYTYDPTTSATTIDEQLNAQSELKKFSDYSQLADFIDNNSTSSYYGLDSFASSRSSDMIMEAPMAALDSDLGTTMNLGTADLEQTITPDYSATNIQVQGVDEGDIVKTDGQYVYSISNNNVHIIEAYPAGDANIVSTIEFTNSTPTSLYLLEDYLVVYGQESNLDEKPFYDLIRPYSEYTFFKIFNIKDKANPTQVRDLKFEGNYQNSRMIGDYIYFITSQPTYNIDENYPIPMIVEDEELLSIDTGVARCNCPDVYYIDAPYTFYTFTTVTAINIKDANKEISSEAYLLGGSENMYVSPENIYIAYTKYLSEEMLTMEVLRDMVYPKLSAKRQQQINDIEDTPNHVLSRSEKLIKMSLIVSQYVMNLSENEQETIQAELEKNLKAKYDDISKELEKTVIHKIAMDEDKLTYKGSGEVTGNVLNQFAMDEHEGYFRIATTKNRTWSNFEDTNTESYNNVYVLDENLKVVGSVENLAEGERIYSARFMQGRVYLVTFRQTDPLFVIDLKDPKNPTVLGELKVPGFSSYLHPFDETTLIGFGKQADEDGRVQGLKLSLFDVSDVENLKEIDTYEMGDTGSDSIALNDHKAFLFSGAKNLLVVPVSLRDQLTAGSYRSVYTNGAMVFEITKDGFTFRDKINHGDKDESGSEYYYYGYYDTSVRRSLYIEDLLYTLSTKYLKMNKLDDLSEIKTLELEAKTSGDFIIR
ncbi:MAG: beta-propeller domain-containing protein [bacterium]|nr:beta-propeller domain-containing protein [bacterium]